MRVVESSIIPFISLPAKFGVDLLFGVEGRSSQRPYLIEGGGAFGTLLFQRNGHCYPRFRIDIAPKIVGKKRDSFRGRFCS
jgi:hypothetical protein